jgi:hypothetical protein
VFIFRFSELTYLDCDTWRFYGDEGSYFALPDTASSDGYVLTEKLQSKLWICSLVDFSCCYLQYLCYACLRIINLLRLIWTDENAMTGRKLSLNLGERYQREFNGTGPVSWIVTESGISLLLESLEIGFRFRLRKRSRWPVSKTLVRQYFNVVPLKLTA